MTTRRFRCAQTLVLTGWLLAQSYALAQIAPDQLPMYGGMDRAKVHALKAADDQLIAETTARFGSARKASDAFVNSGFSSYQKNDFAVAMRRFNQAWLIDPTHPDVYWGFASVLQDKQDYCGAKEMLTKAISLNPPDFVGIYSDAGRVFTLCAVHNKDLSQVNKDEIFTLADRYYLIAEQKEPNKGYVYSSKATAFYWRGEYSEAWSMVKKAKSLRADVPAKFESMLRAKMPEPLDR
jgi:tetratricopeptide (TPR) repeat protein